VEKRGKEKHYGSGARLSATQHKSSPKKDIQLYVSGASRFRIWQGIRRKKEKFTGKIALLLRESFLDRMTIKEGIGKKRSVGIWA